SPIWTLLAWSGVTYVLLPPAAGDDLMSMPGASEMTTSISTTARKQDGLSCWSQTGPVVR
ncbi:hypothetical protein OFB97_27475, partial [Escherichia coli]|nr:hypothetical protein [Escherichia coli]